MSTSGKKKLASHEITYGAPTPARVQGPIAPSPGPVRVNRSMSSESHMTKRYIVESLMAYLYATDNLLRLHDQDLTNVCRHWLLNNVPTNSVKFQSGTMFLRLTKGRMNMVHDWAIDLVIKKLFDPAIMTYLNVPKLKEWIKNKYSEQLVQFIRSPHHVFNVLEFFHDMLMTLTKSSLNAIHDNIRQFLEVYIFEIREKPTRPGFFCQKAKAVCGFGPASPVAKKATKQ